MRQWIIAYVIVAIFFGWWHDAMDSRYGVLPRATPQNWLLTTAAASIWPITMPIEMIIAATGGSNRWHLPPYQTKEKSDIS